MDGPGAAGNDDRSCFAFWRAGQWFMTAATVRMLLPGLLRPWGERPHPDDNPSPIQQQRWLGEHLNHDLKAIAGATSRCLIASTPACRSWESSHLPPCAAWPVCQLVMRRKISSAPGSSREVQRRQGEMGGSLRSPSSPRSGQHAAMSGGFWNEEG